MRNSFFYVLDQLSIFSNFGSFCNVLVLLWESSSLCVLLFPFCFHSFPFQSFSKTWFNIKLSICSFSSKPSMTSDDVCSTWTSFLDFPFLIFFVHAFSYSSIFFGCLLGLYSIDYSFSSCIVYFPSKSSFVTTSIFLRTTFSSLTILIWL
jgi:hypothetical protein